MRILAVSASADWSTVDVSNGYMAALDRAGVDVRPWRLNRRLVRVGEFLGLEPTRQSLSEISRHASRMIVADAVEQEPDWIVLFSAMAFHPDALQLLRKVRLEDGARFRIACVFTESPYDDPDHEYLEPFADLVACNDKASAEKHGWLHLGSAFDPTRHRKIDVDLFNTMRREANDRERDEWATGGKTGIPVPSEPLMIHRHDVVVVGTGWEERVARLKRVNWEGIDLGLYGFWPQLSENLEDIDFSQGAGLRADAEGRAALQGFYSGRPTVNDETVALYSAAMIAVNDHRFHTLGWSANPRVYEALAVGGALLLTDYRPELEPLLGDRWREFVFTDHAELEAKIRYYLGNEDARQELVEYGKARVQGQTFDARADTLLGALRGAERGTMKQEGILSAI